VARILGRVAGDQRLALRSRDIKLEISGQEIAFTADADMLRIALDNLVSNAIKYSPPGGTIHIRTARDATHVALDVVDEGPGILPAERERVFEPFFQGATPGNGAVRGTGIGLSVVREYVAAHGGSVEVLDSHCGAHLRMRLPLAGPARAGTMHDQRSEAAA
jgi:two-component system sensor histidine kinase GlrK